MRWRHVIRRHTVVSVSAPGPRRRRRLFSDLRGAGTGPKPRSEQCAAALGLFAWLLGFAVVVPGAAVAQAKNDEDAQNIEQAAEDDWEDFEEDFEDAGSSAGGFQLPFQLHGFVEGLVGARARHAPTTSQEFTAMESRFRLEIDAEHRRASARFRGDFIVDGVEPVLHYDFRDVSVYLRAADWLSVRVGRQVLTWGTGDFVFLNDLFPKDFVAFFIGRDDAYLKAPSNSVKLTWSFGGVGIDTVWTPIYEGDRFIDGERLVFFDPMQGTLVGPDSPGVPLDPVEPSQRLRHGEYHGRIYGSVGAFELAAYGYAGFWKQPNAFDMAAGLLTYAPLAVYGASVRGPLAGGLFNLEGSFYHSYDDWEGDDPEVPNSQVRYLAGYEHELISKLQLGAQYYLEQILRHGSLMDNSLWPEFEQEALRHVTTLRLTYLLLRDTLELSLFVFFSPSEMDTHLRPRITYHWIDPLAIVVGANLMFGRDDFTFFGQLEENTNVYGRVRYSF